MPSSRRTGSRPVARARSDTLRGLDKKPTFGDLIDRQQLDYTLPRAIKKLIAGTEAAVAEFGKTKLRVASCFDCSAPKGCCSLRVGVYLHEAVPIAQRLRRDSRDTPELRAALATSADLMESPGDYRRPCALLDANERCTVYDVRPIECGTTFVFSPPAMCSDRQATELEKFPVQLGDAPRNMEKRFEREARLVPLQGLYMGVLPRMLLLCLEAWERSDYAQYLAEQMPLVAKRMVALTRGR